MRALERGSVCIGRHSDDWRRLAFIARLPLLLLAASLTTGGCDEQPKVLNPGFHWQESVTDMRDALLGTCSFEGAAYAVGGLSDAGALYRWTSRRWLQEATNVQGERLWSCWAGRGQVVYAVGQGGTIFRHNGEGWRRDLVPESVQEADLFSVWGMPDGTAVAVGGLGDPTETAVILHFDGQTWTRADASYVRTKTLRGVWGSSADNYFAVGDDGVIAHFDGNAWEPSNSQVSDRLYAIHGIGPNESYVVGGTGIVLRWNGSSWIAFDKLPESLRTVWTGPGLDLYVGGDNGFVARYDRLHDLPEPERVVSANPFPHLRVHDLVGLGSSVLGAAATIITGDDGEWRGSVVGHGRSFAGPVFESAAPDAAVPDAGPPDASTDAGP